jgi:mRNA-degrading endonuclease RelE of RelBE toxin-antitoxin system
MRIVKILPSFERSLKKLSSRDKDKLKQTLVQFNEFLVSDLLPVGLGFKKINHNKYELRVDIRLRVIIKIEKEYVYFVLAGSHDSVKRYLREYR